MNILFSADVSIADVIGGAERVLFEQTTGLARRGHKVSIITRKLPEHFIDHQVVNGVDEWRYECNIDNPWSFLISSIKNSKKLFEKLHLQNRYGCVNFHQPFSAIGIFASEFSKSLPKFYTCHSFSFEEFSSRNGQKKGAIRKAINYFQIQARKKIEKSVFDRSDEIIVLSQFTGNKLIDTYSIPRQKIEVIPGGVDPKKFHPADDKARIRKQLNIPQDKFIIFTVRNLVPRMGLENLIIAFNQLKQKAKNIQLVIGGNGPLKERLMALSRSFGIEQIVHFTGFIKEDQLPLYYQMADLFVLPSKELEGFGLVTLEAMASGLPVIGTPVGGTKEILGKFNSKFLFDDSKPDSIANLALDKYLTIKNDPQHWNQISYQCRKFVEKNYSWKQNIDSLERLIQRHTDQ